MFATGIYCSKARGLTCSLIHRVSETAHVRRLRGTATLDRDHQPFADHGVVFSRSGMVGTGLSATDGVS